MTQVSSAPDALPPKDAPLAERLDAAMIRADYSNRRLARELGTDSSLVGKWRNGKVQEIRAIHHQVTLAKLLKTPADYWRPPRGGLAARVARLEEEFAEIRALLLPGEVA